MATKDKSVRYHSMAPPRRVEHFGGEELGRGRLPCGLEVDFTRGECCRTLCPDLAKRGGRTRQPDNLIEQCYNGLRRDGQ